MGAIPQVPHCDSRILHAPEDGCVYCNACPEWQEARRVWGIAFTGHQTGPGEVPCPADVARPAGSPSDHRRWGGNTPTSAKGDPSWPLGMFAPFASHLLQGDQGGHLDWPLGERIRRRLTRPWHALIVRRR